MGNYPGAIDWTFRNTKDRVWTVNTIMYLMIQRFSAENFILDMKEVIEFLQTQDKQHKEVLAEKDERIEDLQKQLKEMEEDTNPEKEVKRRTEMFNRHEEIFKQKEEIFRKQTTAFEHKEAQMEKEFARL